jgi:toxin-antitoxin system PIN domain toxin
VNVLVYGFREDAPEHVPHRDWLMGLVHSPEPYAVSDHVLSGFLRIVTHPRIFHPPAPIDTAITFANGFRHQPNAVAIEPGQRHWEIFEGLCRDAGARGNLIPDAWLAALAIESGCEFITTDRDFSRFPGLRWRHPLTGRG